MDLDLQQVAVTEKLAQSILSGLERGDSKREIAEDSVKYVLSFLKGQAALEGGGNNNLHPILKRVVSSEEALEEVEETVIEELIELAFDGISQSMPFFIAGAASIWGLTTAGSIILVIISVLLKRKVLKTFKRRSNAATQRIKNANKANNSNKSASTRKRNKEKKD
jgi:heme exporter protein D